MRLLLLCFLLAQSAASAPAQSVIPPLLLWPAGKMPGHGAEGPETVQTAGQGSTERITDVSQPALTVYPVQGAKAPTAAAMICPGGGYRELALAKEGSEIAEWLNSLGITGVVLKYRVPNNREGAFQDAQRGLRLIRAHAKEWNIDPKRLGVIGFSAGGHLGARLSTGYGAPAYAKIDAADAQDCRPDFAILVYPAYLADKAGALAPELKVSGAVPPTLIVHSEDDPAYLPGSKAYHQALDAAKVSNKFLLYPTGGHGYGLHCQKDARAWPGAAREWLAGIGIGSR